MSGTEQTPITSQEELLTAPERDYMSARQLAFFRERLLEQREVLMQSADSTLAQLRERPHLADELDRASAEEEYALALRMRDRERRLLRKIEQALHRIDQGEYGWCEETGEPIGLRRLLARPTATLSVEGQERKEAREHAFRDQRTGS